MRFISVRLLLVCVLSVVGLGLAGPLSATVASNTTSPSHKPSGVNLSPNSASENYVLVNSVFASGSGGVPLASASYRMDGTVGETGLPNNQTALASASYQQYPGFLAALIAPRSLFLPLTMRNYSACFIGPAESEPNNLATQANGPLCSGRSYTGQFNDQDDYFSFTLASMGSLSITLSGVSVADIQLQLRDANNNLVGYSAGPTTYQINCPNATYPTCGQAGLYYIRVIASAGSQTGTSYTLTATYSN